MKRQARQHIVLTGDLQEHSVREVCQGAAEYAAQKSDLDFDPWPVTSWQPIPFIPVELRQVNGLIATEPAFKLVCGGCRRVGIPRVFFLSNFQHPHVPCVALDEDAIGRMAAEHLIARGYRHLAFVGSSAMRWSRMRGHGFNQVAASAGCVVKKHEFPLNKLPVYWSCKWVKWQLSLRQILQALPKPCGIFAANDVIACFIIETARLHGIRVPQQVGVIGVDDDPIPNAAAGLAISSVQVPFREVGRQAAQLLEGVDPRRVAVAPRELHAVRAVHEGGAVAPRVAGHHEELPELLLQCHRRQQLLRALILRWTERHRVQLRRCDRRTTNHSEHKRSRIGNETIVMRSCL